MKIRKDISKTPLSLSPSLYVIPSYLKLDEKKVWEKNTLSFGGKLDKS